MSNKACHPFKMFLKCWYLSIGIRYTSSLAKHSSKIYRDVCIATFKNQNFGLLTKKLKTCRTRSKK